MINPCNSNHSPGLDVPALSLKCNRTKFTDDQKEALELFLSQNPRLTHEVLEEFAHEQNLTISAVRNWVNNRKQRMKRGSTGFEESPGKYPRIEGPDVIDDEGSFQTSSQKFEASVFHDVESEEVPTMVSTAPYDQNSGPQRVTTEFEGTRASTEVETSGFNGVGNTSVVDIPTPAFKQENNGQKQCEYNAPIDVSMECLSPEQTHNLVVEQTQ